MQTSGISSSLSQQEPTQYSQDRSNDSSGNGRAVDTVSAKAVRRGEPVDRSQSRAEQQPSAIFIRSESRYEASYVESVRTARAAPLGDRISSDEAAGNILSFIENQLLRDVEDGASQDELISRIEAGLSGFVQGFEAARDDLQALNVLSPELQGEIDKTYAAVLEGVEALKQTFTSQATAINGPDDQIDTPSATASSDVATADSTVVSTTDVSGPRFQSQYFGYEAAQQNSFEFTVTTRDGDRVTIQSSALRSLVQENASFTTAGGASGEYSQYAYGEDLQFQLEVDGELDSGEVKALQELLSQVNDLAEDFFSGDVTAAFDAALSLGYNESEISSFALNLSQTSVQRATSAYQAVGALPGSGIGSLGQQLQPLGNFARGLVEATQTAQNFQNPRELIETLSDRIDSVRPQDGFKSFLERLLSSVEF